VSRPRFIRGRLPAGWERELAPPVVAKVRLIERYSDRGLIRVTDLDHKGYRWASLCVGHPYANGRGVQRLHRYLLMRALGRRLDWFEHGHHLPDVPKDTLDVYGLELVEACDHGVWHYGVRLRCGQHLPLWKPRNERGEFNPLPTPESVRAALDAVTGGDHPLPPPSGSETGIPF
jgi:hypothetical protein